MIPKIIKTEDDFLEYCPCSYRIIKYVDSVKSDVRWFFDACYYEMFDNSYSVIFKTYINEEYKNYVLSISATYSDNSWVIKLFKKIDGLTPGT